MGHESRPEAILIAGLTASGKSQLALAWAARIGGLVINADSMQVYRDLRILTARPTSTDEARVPHALYGTRDGATGYSVSLWLADAVAAIRQAEEGGLVPMFVGGTGLYFKALLQGLSEIPTVPTEVRAHWRAWAEGRPVKAINAELQRRDPLAAAHLRPTDPQRLLRAIEVHAATGESIIAFQGRRAPGPLAGRRVTSHVLELDRALLRERVERRLDAMIEAGALDEVSRLAKRNLEPSLPVMRALGVPQFLRHLRGEIDVATALGEAKTATRAYLKRQATFFRHQLPEFVAVDANVALGDAPRVSIPSQ